MSSLEYLFVLGFILNKTLWSFGSKFALKSILGTELKTTIVELGISISEYHFTNFYSKQSTLKFPDQIYLEKLF